MTLTHYVHHNTPPTPLDALKQRAKVDVSAAETYGIRRWIHSVNVLYDQGHIALENHDSESAYISFMRGYSIMVEIVKHHSGYTDILQDTLYLQLKKRTSEEVYPVLKYLAEKITASYRTPYNYAYRPSHDPRNYPNYSLNQSSFHPSPVSPPTMIEASELIRYMNQLHILLIDLRPPPCSERIHYRYIIQLDPALFMSVTEQSILDYMKPEERQLFKDRHRFDLVVYYDQNSRHMNAMFYQLRTLLSTPSRLLVGGFDSWKRSAGSTQPVSLKSPISKPIPLPTAPRKESMQYPSHTVTHDPHSSICPLPPSYAVNKHKTYRDQPVTNTFLPYQPSQVIGTTGLKNLGNTCYMNSILQCLCATVPLARYFISGSFRQHINMRNKMSTGGVLSESFAQLLQVMWSDTYNFISPLTFKESLIRFAPQFSGGEQHDSQEFLTFLLDGLHEDTNRPSQAKTLPEEIEKMPEWKAATSSWECHLSRNKSIIVDLFQGQYKSVLTCLHCRKTSTTYSTFMSLSVPVPVKKMRLSNITLYHCLDYFVKEEVLEKEDAWFCPQCKKKRRATKQLTLSRLPDILLIHLKRFSLHGQLRHKIDAMVKCPTRSVRIYSEYTATHIP